MGEICQIFHDSGVYFSLFCQVWLCTCGIVCVFCEVRFRIITAPGVVTFIEIEFPFHP